MKKSILITGGAGFIGSHLADALIAHPEVALIRVLDNLSTGKLSNIEHHLNNPNFEYLEGDIRNFATCEKAMTGIDIVCHQAALGSVPRSIEDPLTTNEVNITGTLNVFTSAKNSGIKRIVYAASSSTYGDSQQLPKVEDKIGLPLSPYAVTKYVNELYARVFGDLYNIDLIGLRYFNVFGPRQDPDGQYAAVIPLFNKAILDNVAPYINGDGEQSRDFTFIDNVVQININAIFTNNKEALNHVYNVAVGERITINEMWQELKTIGNSSLEAKYRATRQGDVRASLADISKAKDLLKYDPKIKVKEGLRMSFEWYKNSVSKQII